MIGKRSVRITLLGSLFIPLIIGLSGCCSICSVLPDDEITPSAPPSTSTTVPTPGLTVTPLPISSNVYVEYIFDASGSMNQRDIDGRSRLEVAKDVLGLRTRAIPPSTNVGLRVYGHRLPSDDPQSCQDIELMVPVISGGRDQILNILPALEAHGMTPMSESITHAVDDLPWDDPQAQCSIVLISDGEETCGDDPCEVVDILVNEWGISFTAHVIGYAVRDNQTALRQMQCIADFTGGTFHLADSEQELSQAIDQIWQDIGEDAGDSGAPPVLPEGDLEVRLSWYETADLDLYVTDPNGDLVFHGQRDIPSGGELNRDANFPCEDATTDAVEYVYWPSDPPSGEYEVMVNYFGECDSEGDVEFTLYIESDGDVIYHETHTLSPNEEFEYTFSR
jgi:hypothetical protein